MTTQEPQSSDENPYQAPQSDDSLAQPQQGIRDGDAERIRNQYLNHEILVRSIGAFLLLIGTLAFLATSWLVALVLLHGTGWVQDPIADYKHARVYLLGGAFAYALISAFALCLGYGLWNLQNWLRFAIGILAGASFLFFPYAIIVIAPFCLIIFSKHSRFIFSPEFKAVIQETPHIRIPVFLLFGSVCLVFFGMILLLVLTLFAFTAFRY